MLRHAWRSPVPCQASSQRCVVKYQIPVQIRQWSLKWLNFLSVTSSAYPPDLTPTLLTSLPPSVSNPISRPNRIKLIAYSISASRLLDWRLRNCCNFVVSNSNGRFMAYWRWPARNDCTYYPRDLRKVSQPHLLWYFSILGRGVYNVPTFAALGMCFCMLDLHWSDCSTNWRALFEESAWRWFSKI